VCPYCKKKFKSAIAVADHCYDTGHNATVRSNSESSSGHNAPVRSSSASSSLSATAHTGRPCPKKVTRNNDHTGPRGSMYQDIRTLNKPHGLNGRWVLTSQIKGTKSFGYYKCKTCENEWSSAHALKTMGQQCRRCSGAKSKVYHIPFAMWVNDDDNRARPLKDTIKPVVKRAVLESVREGCNFWTLVNCIS